MKTRYDSEVDIFTMFDATAGVYGQSIGNKDHILDLDKKGNIIGIEILDASKHFRMDAVELLRHCTPWIRKTPLNIWRKKKD